MGSAGDLPQRSSSPLKRRAEEFDMADIDGNQSDDVDMLTVPDSSTEVEQDSVRIRGGSVDMLQSPDLYSTEIRPSTENVPPIDEQISTVKEIVTKCNESPLKEGDKIYLVSKKWLGRVLAKGSDAKSSKDSEEEVGPIDNSDIAQEILKDADGADFVRLKPGLGSDYFEYFPEEAWNLIVSWYGVAQGTSAIIRVAHNTNSDAAGMEQFQYELHPPIFKLHRVWSEISPLPLPQLMKASQPEAPVLVSSQSERLKSFLLRAKKELQIDVSTKVRIWRVLADQPADSATSQSKTQEEAEPETVGVWGKLLVDAPSFTKLEKGIQREELSDAEDVTVNPKYNGTRTLAMAGLLSDETLVFEEQIKDAPTSNGIWLSALTSQDLSKAGIPARPIAPVKKPPTPTPSGPVTRGRTYRNGKGVVGLSNLGNTCYMNSALQCVKSVEELTKYFLTDEASNEINDDNPLGHNGDVARAYGRLLNDIFKKDSSGSVRPAPFKNIIGRYAPQFSGYGQQDSQEFLGFLLDGLQEDLSRVKKKPYIEKPDSTDEMVNNPELIREMASKVWDITKKRDDSVIADLFTGMYKSTLVCPVCSKVSITFDPFNNLTLQLPIKETFSHPVTFFPLNDRPVELMVDIDKNASFKDLKEFVSKRVDVPANKLIVIDQWNNKVYKLFEDLDMPSEVITSNDKTHVYEIDAVPTNWPAPAKAPKKKKFKNFGYSSEDKDAVPNWDDPIAETILVPVMHRHASYKGLRKSFSNCLVPFYITLNQTEASDLEIIKRKILQRIATLTTFAPLHDEDEEEIENSDMVITSGSDADSSGDGKVVAKSVDGEDDVVDVTMKDGDEHRDGNPEKAPEALYPLKKFKTRRPKFLDPSTFLEPAIQNLFDLSYFTEPGEIIPSGWHSVSDDKPLPKLSERDPQLQPDMRANNYPRKKGRSQSQESKSQASDDDLPDISVTRMTEVSSDEDEDSEPSSSAVRQKRSTKVGHGSGVRKGGLKTYSKKGNRFTDRFSRRVSEESIEPEPTGPIVRLGEGICVEWAVEAYEALFQGDADNTQQGTYTLDKVENLQDPALDRKNKARQLRKRNGVTLEECLDEFQREEILSEMDTWYCPRCKEHRRASKKFELWKTPDILIIHLKRFSSLSNNRSKLDALVDFPIENLDVSSRVIETEPGKQEVYDLFAVDNHMGGLGGGHYTAYAKSFVDKQWYNYNDTMVNKVDPQSVVSSAAYLLFYRRRSEVPLGGPRFQEIVAKYDYPDEEQSSANESGEDQRLDANSSQRGSSSALTGVEVVPHRGGSLIGPRTMEGLEMNQGLPAYQEESDSVPLLLSNNNDVFEDEGVVIEDAAKTPSLPVFENSWSFANLNATQRKGNSSNDGSITERSDVVAHGSEVDEHDMKDRLNEFDSAPLDEDYVADEADAIPDIEMDDNGDRLFTEDVLQNNIHMIQTREPEEEVDDEKVDEIHV